MDKEDEWRLGRKYGYALLKSVPFIVIKVMKRQKYNTSKTQENWRRLLIYLCI